MKQMLLINMPFASLEYPSLALTKIKYIIDKRFRDQISTNILYLNHDFSEIFGINGYKMIDEYNVWGADVHKTGFNNYGIGEWLFRNIAFPNAEDNAVEYFDKFFPSYTKIKNLMLEKRNEISQFMKQIISKYQINNYDIIGFTSMFQQHMPSLAMARMLKDQNLDNIIILGGPNCDYPNGKVFSDNCEAVDYIFSGPSLVSLADFVEYYLNDQLDRASTIPGVFVRGKTELTDDNSKCNYGKEFDINAIEDLDYDNFFNSFTEHFPKHEIEPILLLETSRGCWWAEKSKCNFCAVNGIVSKYQSMSSFIAKRYFRNIFKYSDRCKYFRAVDSVIPINLIKEVLPSLNIPKEVKIYYQVRTELEDEDLKILAKSGVLLLQAGIESMSTEHLELMNKGTSLFDNIIFLKNCVKNGINVIWNILLNIPGEKEEIYNYYTKTLPLLVHLFPPSEVLPINYSRFNDYVDHPQKYNIKLKPVTEIYAYLYPFSKECIDKMAYFYERVNEHEICEPVNNGTHHIIYFVETWKRMWSKNISIPKLYLDFFDGRKVVYDSRQKNLLLHEIDDMDFNILETTNKEKDFNEIMTCTACISIEIMQEKIFKLLEKGLLITERGKYLSLVFNQEPILQENFIVQGETK